MTFHNLEVVLSDLPHVFNIKFKEVDKKYAPIALGTTVIRVLIPLFIVLTVAIFWIKARTFLASSPGNLLIIIAPLIITWITLYAWLSAKAIRFALRQHDLILKSGIFWKTETIQPLQRVQHIALTQGPLDKHFGLANLRLFSAGTGRSTLTIPGLPFENAEQIRQFILDYKEGENTIVETVHEEI